MLPASCCKLQQDFLNYAFPGALSGSRKQRTPPTPIYPSGPCDRVSDAYANLLRAQNASELCAGELSDPYQGRLKTLMQINQVFSSNGGAEVMQFFASGASSRLKETQVRSYTLRFVAPAFDRFHSTASRVSPKLESHLVAPLVKAYPGYG